MEPTLIGECPSRWVCLFENAHFDDWNQDGIDDGARMLRFSATGHLHEPRCDRSYNFGDPNNDKMSMLWICTTSTAF
jgi:hypothetical protein